MVAGLLLLAPACSSSSSNGVTPPVEANLGVGGSAAIIGTPWRVMFDSVISDSRCPVDALCIQAGEALLALELTSPYADPLPQDNPHFSLGASPVTVEGFQFTTLDVAPLRHVGDMVDPKSYRVTLRIEAAGAL
jgi:hypothetical protein